MPQSTFFYPMTVQEDRFAPGESRQLCESGSLPVMDKRGVQVDTMGNFLWGPEFYGDCLASV
jgi:hypothetical protein